jgi:Flp pilus assembly protein TadD
VGVIDTLGWAVARAGRLDEAMRHLRDARLRAPDDPEIRWHLGYALARQGRIDEARAELSIALQRAPGGAWADEARTLLDEFK